MDSTNKIISFILGLVVVIVFIVIITGRLNLKKINFLPLSKNTPTVTPTVTPTPKATSLSVVNQQTDEETPTLTANSYQTIPATGTPTIFLPLALSGLLGGIYLRKKNNS